MPRRIAAIPTTTARTRVCAISRAPKLNQRHLFCSRIISSACFLRLSISHRPKPIETPANVRRPIISDVTCDHQTSRTDHTVAARRAWPGEGRASSRRGAGRPGSGQEAPQASVLPQDFGDASCATKGLLTHSGAAMRRSTQLGASKTRAMIKVAKTAAARAAANPMAASLKKNPRR